MRGGVDDSDDDVPILQRPAALKAKEERASEQQKTGSAKSIEGKGEESDDDDPVVAQTSGTGAVMMMRILEPLATFVGTTRMPKRDALTKVLDHIRNKDLFDPNDDVRPFSVIPCFI